MATEYDLGSVVGPMGAQGVQGVSVTNATINASGKLIITLSNGNTVDAGSAIGPKGATGATGPAGKTAYASAVTGGYTGTEAQFNALLGGLQTTLNGKVPQSRAVNGKALTADIALTAADVGASNRNLLDNWYFPNAVNQRGAVSYSTNNAYAIDRWMLSAAGAGNTASYVPGTRMLTCGTRDTNGYYANLQQTFEFSSALAGQTVTLTGLADSTDLLWMVQCWWNPGGGATASLGAATYSTELLSTTTFRVPDEAKDGDRVRVVLQTRGKTVLRAAKLELGSVQTLARQQNGVWILNDPPPNYAEELAKCQRYQYVNTRGSSQFIRAASLSASMIYFDIPTPVTMRATPALVSSAAIGVRGWGASADATGFTFACTGGNGSIRVGASKANHGLTDAVLSPATALFDANL